MELGFDLVGITSADAPAHTPFLDEWLSRGYAGEMSYLHRTAAARKNIRERYPWVETLVCVAVQYPKEKPTRGLGRHIARYAQGEDYHIILDRPLKQLEDFILEQAKEKMNTAPQTRRYIDTGPVMEKGFAAAAGIGWIGKNTMVLNESHGSYFLLAEILTSIHLPPDPPAVDRCGSCTLCLEACPTGAFVGPYVLDATRCISYHTIETKTAIPPAIAGHIGGNLFGCDICQEVCPYNRVKSPASRRARPEYEGISLADLESMPEERFRTVFRKTPLKRPGLEKLKSTAKILKSSPNAADTINR